MGETLRFIVDTDGAGERLDHYLAARLSRLSRMRIANLLAEGACLVNGRPSRPGYHLEAGDLVEITLTAGPPTAMDAEPIPLDVLYEDIHLLVVVKPSGMLVHPTRGVKRGTLANALAYHLNRLRIEDDLQPQDSDNPHSRRDFVASCAKEIRDPQSITRPGIVHRLDRDTSGLMVVAKTQRALSILSRHFNRRLVRKRYVALVAGRVPADDGEIVAPIGRDHAAQPHWRVMEGGKDSKTRFRVLERRGAVTVLELEPVTGRTNQLRIHCAWAGHPILGDRLYGGDRPFEISDTKSKIPARLCLHASELAFHHPAGGEWMEFHSTLPPDIVKVLT